MIDAAFVNASIGAPLFLPSALKTIALAARFIPEVLTEVTLELIVNLKTARTLGLAISETFLVRADGVIDQLPMSLIGTKRACRSILAMSVVG